MLSPLIVRATGSREQNDGEFEEIIGTDGGRLFIGINEQNYVKGVLLNYKKRDEIRNSLINLAYTFYPKCRINKVTVYFLPIKDMISKKFISKRFVIKIRILPGEPEMLYSFTNVGYHSTIRKNGECFDLDSNQIYCEIEQRDELKYIKNLDKNIINEIKDPEPEININDLENHHNNKEIIPIFEENNLH